MGKISISLSKNLNKIINIPYIIIFTSENFKAVLSQEELDEKRNLSYDSIIIVLDPFFDPVRVISSFDKLIRKLKIRIFHLKKEVDGEKKTNINK